MRIVLIFIALFAFAPLVSASIAVRLSFSQIVQQSDHVARVVLESSQSFWGSDRRRIYTRYTFRVLEHIGPKGQRQITLVQPGGEQDGLMQISHGYPSFSKTKQQVLFLKDTQAGVEVVGLCQGVFDIDDSVVGKKWVQRQEPNLRLVPVGVPILLDGDEAVLIVRNRFANRSVP